MSFLLSRKMKRNDLIVLLSSLSYMTRAGLSTKQALETLVDDKENKLDKTVPKLMLKRVTDGLRLWEIFKENEKILGTGMWEQIEAAEKTGKLADCLLRIVEQLKNDAGVASKIRGALSYPIFICIVGLGAGYYMFTNVIPEMGEILMEFDATLPAITLQAMAISNLMIERGPLVMLVLGLLIVGLIMMLRGPFRMQWHKFIVKSPLAGTISVNVNYSLIYLILCDMTENGAPMSEALRVAAGSSKNAFIKQELIHASEIIVTQGLGLSEALSNCVSMPSDDRLMLKIGTSTGYIMDMLAEMASRRKIAGKEAVDRLLEMLNPITMVIVCIAVAYLVLAVYYPMLTMASSLS